MSFQRTQRGYLLLELVAAVALLAIAVAALLPAVAGRTESAREAEMFHRVCDLERRARLLSLRDGPVRITVDESRGELRATPVDAPVAALRVRADRAELHLLDPGTRAELPAVPIDRLGRSMDYLLLIRHDGTDRILRVDGLTGRVSHDAEGLPS